MMRCSSRINKCKACLRRLIKKQYFLRALLAFVKVTRQSKQLQMDPQVQEEITIGLSLKQTGHTGA